MKTSVELQKEKVELAKRLGAVGTIRELLDRALDAYIAQERRMSMARLLGTGFYDSRITPDRKQRGLPRR
mgnify:CR=1 FL=1